MSRMGTSKVARRRVKSRATKAVATRLPTPRERRAAGHRLTCDICHAKINEPLGRGRFVQIWSFTIKGANGKIFNRCRRHLGTKVRV